MSELTFTIEGIKYNKNVFDSLFEIYGESVGIAFCNLDSGPELRIVYHISAVIAEMRSVDQFFEYSVVPQNQISPYEYLLNTSDSRRVWKSSNEESTEGYSGDPFVDFIGEMDFDLVYFTREDIEFLSRAMGRNGYISFTSATVDFENLPQQLTDPGGDSKTLKAYVNYGARSFSNAVPALAIGLPCPPWWFRNFYNSKQVLNKIIRDFSLTVKDEKMVFLPKKKFPFMNSDPRISSTDLLNALDESIINLLSSFKRKKPTNNV